ncbi:2-keto-4-pentenoate hydratase [Arthrobacter sp. efr-133-TYG-118]|uniref:2-keto-4-pentenoate hydratase n=1 Tax=Arthrobacter sp. efr-133-TYG-118 TaxID=3040279 RepID=UPI00254C9C5F|nr:2-keto-4-pentenoate hydratase [Arthrobacter sp. efr-133-TYG-118]
MKISSRDNDAAQALLDAYRTHNTVAPLTDADPGLSVEGAYRIQLEQVQAWKTDGRTVKGHKVGLTSRAMQVQLGVDQPDFGHLMDDMFFADTDPIKAGRFISPKVEPEFAFVLGKSLTGPGVTAAEALSAIDYVVGALEIIDSRITNWKIKLADTIADNASSGGVVLGSKPVKPADLDLRTTGVNLSRNGELVASGAGGAVLESPLNALVWLANTLGPLGVTLKAGSVILPGSMTAAVAAGPGDTISASFAGGLGTVTANFAN